jgi:ribonuclease Z
VDEPDQPGRIDAAKCAQLGLPPGSEYERLKNGFDVVSRDGTVIKPSDVVGGDRPGRRLCLLGDTCDSIGIARLAMGADVLIHESTFAACKHQEAVYKGHSTSRMAGEFARVIGARNLLLTHFSNRYGTANTRLRGTDGSEGRAFSRNGKREKYEDDVEDDMALPEGAPEDMRAAAQEEFTLVEGLVREASEAKGDSRVVAASDFFAFNVQRRESFDECDRLKGDREGLFSGPTIAPTLELYEDARRRLDAGVKGYYSPNYSSDSNADDDGGRFSRGRPSRGGGRAYESRDGGGRRGRGRARDASRSGRESGGGRESIRGFARSEDGGFQRRADSFEKSSFSGAAGRPTRISRSGASLSNPSFDIESASIDASSFARQIQRRREE